MVKYSKINIINHIQKWMDSVAGQTFLNYAYSWGASVVILGTLFKLTHLPGADTMLYIGMGTEVFVFFLAAFDRPFDKTTDGIELKADRMPSTSQQTPMEDGSQIESAKKRMIATMEDAGKQIQELSSNMSALNDIITKIRQALTVGK